MSYYINLDEDTHIYNIYHNIDDITNEYEADISVTGLIKRYCDHFNAIAMAKNIVDKCNSIPTITHISQSARSIIPQNSTHDYSKYNNMTEQDILNLWESKRDHSAKLGTALHRCIEIFYNFFIIHNNINNRIYDIRMVDHIFSHHNSQTRENVVPDEYFRNFIAFHNNLADHIVPVHAELIISNFKSYNKHLHNNMRMKIIAGSIDMVYMNMKTRKIILCDWKRVEKISTDNYGKYFYEPIEHMKHSKYNEYSLQLNIYKILFEDTYEYEVESLWLVNLLGNEYQYYNIPFCTEAKDILVYGGYIA